MRPPRAATPSQTAPTRVMTNEEPPKCFARPAVLSSVPCVPGLQRYTCKSVSTRLQHPGSSFMMTPPRRKLHNQDPDGPLLRCFDPSASRWDVTPARHGASDHRGGHCAGAPRRSLAVAASGSPASAVVPINTGPQGPPFRVEASSVHCKQHRLIRRSIIDPSPPPAHSPCSPSFCSRL